MNHSSIDSANKQGFAFAIGAALLFSCKPIIIKWAYNYGIDVVNSIKRTFLCDLYFFQQKAH
ncbi:MAG: hypothetical protein KBT75_14150 [Oleispira antarctica]|uniref:Uncharacterized protein n=1 Tax=Oleispira antarctica RB-8 TaxID=698738 RepID=R4YPN8_OLEAN|nr:hypothetical protein [Oleispira antarctica]MBQ0791255.1 hypothetical protein [Oleispira antarctica]CCK77017.1 hypothetical protein OLEAN_C28410 [Oleispira antarctica RB-8]|tara:strand:+ start:1969 stop:2154 length:186 start_codon:yes stop_codon:yes gene_type:complete